MFAFFPTAVKTTAGAGDWMLARSRGPPYGSLSLSAESKRQLSDTGARSFLCLCPGSRVHALSSVCLFAQAVSELVTVAECEAGPEDGPEDGQHVGRDVDVGLEYRHPGVIHCVKQRGQPVSHREDRERVPGIRDTCFVIILMTLVPPEAVSCVGLTDYVPRT